MLQHHFNFFTFEIINFRDAEVQRLDAKVSAPPSQYAMICKHAPDDVKYTFAARDREFTGRRQLNKVRERNPRNGQMVSQAESELMKAFVEMSRVVKGLEEQINSFERRKLHDLKSVLLDFVTIELRFHRKALELLTKAYQDIESRDFRETMRAPDSVTKLDTVNRTSFRHAYSLTNLANRFASSPATLQKLANREAESADSVQTRFTNSSKSVQVLRPIPPIPTCQKSFISSIISIIYRIPSKMIVLYTYFTYF
ncbi:hypothetical protein DMN91_008230 [Ooceraea biroi]|uniref:Protein FAM92A1 n=1 Tax=Ooceraea biroi TaxID=2015173 RepID=A0A3L8DHN5_OOCBI|nr:hypothetical protein DMN91_008230 [Ooceraea biroi]